MIRVILVDVKTGSGCNIAYSIDSGVEVVAWCCKVFSSRDEWQSFSINVDSSRYNTRNIYRINELVMDKVCQGDVKGLKLEFSIRAYPAFRCTMKTQKASLQAKHVVVIETF